MCPLCGKIVFEGKSMLRRKIHEGICASGIPEGEEPETLQGLELARSRGIHEVHTDRGTHSSRSEAGVEEAGHRFLRGFLGGSKKLQELLESKGFDVHSVVCKVGGFEKEQFSIPTMGKGDHACNPILQAMVLNQAKTELNIILGLCLGHDILFQAYSEAPTTTLVVKDRVLAHNPIGAIYSRYHFEKLKKR